jgi:hypothetical protein
MHPDVAHLARALTATLLGEPEDVAQPGAGLQAKGGSGTGSYARGVSSPGRKADVSSACFTPYAAALARPDERDFAARLDLFTVLRARPLEADVFFRGFARCARPLGFFAMNYFLFHLGFSLRPLSGLAVLHRIRFMRPARQGVGGFARVLPEGIDHSGTLLTKNATHGQSIPRNGLRATCN